MSAKSRSICCVPKNICIIFIFYYKLSHFVQSIQFLLNFIIMLMTLFIIIMINNNNFHWQVVICCRQKIKKLCVFWGFYFCLFILCRYINFFANVVYTIYKNFISVFFFVLIFIIFIFIYFFRILKFLDFRKLLLIYCSLKTISLLFLYLKN